ncbi:MAG: hypothetical protein LC674_00895, partial [Actinobacteria bacterium]|nr:hypothetical protein [Actinomycetota bacterium]
LQPRPCPSRKFPDRLAASEHSTVRLMPAAGWGWLCAHVGWLCAHRHPHPATRTPSSMTIV